MTGLVRRPLRRLAARSSLAALAAVLLAACSSDGPVSTGTTGALPAAAPRVVGADTPSSRENERILASYGGAYRWPKAETLLSEVATKLSATSDRPDIQYRITILNSPAVNAFALPTGELYLTRGLLALANDTSEIAGVLAHEMAHVTARHAFARADRERQAAIVSRVVTDVLSDPDKSALALARSKMALARFSQEQELEADQIGVRTIGNAGYDPYGAARFLASMGRSADLRMNVPRTGADAYDFLSTHPSTPQRVSLAVAAARQFGAPGKGERDRERYLEAIDGMVYGEDPAQGIIHGRRFLHPKLGFTFTVPAGYALENGSDAVLAVGSDGNALRFDRVDVADGQDLAAYLTSGWIDSVAIERVETLKIDGLDAATAVARGNEWTFRIAAMRVEGATYRMVFAARNLTDEVDLAFLESLKSFRRLSETEIREVRPLRIETRTVRFTDTLESLARRMAVDDQKMERFLVLNGLEPGAKLSFGDQVKLVAD